MFPGILLRSDRREISSSLKPSGGNGTSYTKPKKGEVTDEAASLSGGRSPRGGYDRVSGLGRTGDGVRAGILRPARKGDDDGVHGQGPHADGNQRKRQGPRINLSARTAGVFED